MVSVCIKNKRKKKIFNEVKLIRQEEVKNTSPFPLAKMTDYSLLQNYSEPMLVSPNMFLFLYRDGVLLTKNTYTGTEESKSHLLEKIKDFFVTSFLEEMKKKNSPCTLTPLRIEKYLTTGDYTCVLWFDFNYILENYITPREWQDTFLMKRVPFTLDGVQYAALVSPVIAPLEL